MGHSKWSCQRQGNECLKAWPEVRRKPVWLKTFLAKPWSKKEQRQGQHTPASSAKRSKDSLTQAVKSWAWPAAFVAGHAPHRVGFIDAFEDNCNSPEHIDTPTVNTYAIFGNEMLQGPWNRLLLTSSTDIQQVKNTLFLISCAPPVITELAGKLERLQTWPFNCAFIADANREIQGKRMHLTVFWFNPAKLNKVLFLTKYSLQHSGFNWTSRLSRRVIQEQKEDNLCNLLLLSHKAAECQLV